MILQGKNSPAPLETGHPIPDNDTALQDPAPQDKDPALPQDKDSAVPQDKDSAVPQDKDPAVPQDKDTAVPQDKDPSVPQGKDPAVPQDPAPLTASSGVTSSDLLHFLRMDHSAHRNMTIDLTSHEAGSHDSTPMLMRTFSEGGHLQPGWMPPNLVAPTRSVNNQDVATEFASGVTTFPTCASASTTMPGDDHRGTIIL